MKQNYDLFEFKQQVLFGGLISNKHKDFQTLAQLGFDDAEDLATFKFIRWLIENPEKPVLDIIEEMIIKTGRASMLRHTKEITRLSMIIGDTRKRRKYGSKT